MADRKIIAVIGATGAQGGGLVRAMMADKSSSFRPRALTRNVNSEKAKALAAAGVEVVAADADEPGTVERAFAGAYGAFCVTNFWEHFSPERELTQAGNMARAAKTAELEHVIWSTLEDTRKWVSLQDDRMPTLMGKYKVPHFDAKGEADQIFRGLGVPTTFPLDEKKLPAIAVEDIGKCAYGIFKRGREFIGKTVGIAGEHLSGAEM